MAYSGTGIDVLALICMGVFFAAIFAVGVYATFKSRARHNSSDLILANRDIGLVFGVFTTTATWMGGPTIMGTAEYVYSPGLGLVNCIAPLGYSICLALGGLLFAKKMRQQKCVTLYDPFLKRFGAFTTALLYIPALMGDIFWSAAVLLALGSTISVLVDLDMNTTMAVAACLVVLYTLFGGLYSVAYTDVIQLIFFFCGLWLCVPFAMNNNAVSNISTTMYNVDMLPINETLKNGMTGWIGHLPSSTSGILSYIDELLLLSLGGIPWQSFFQRILSSKSPTTARTVSLIAAVMCLIIAIPAVLIGAVAVSTDWSQTDYFTHTGLAYIPKNQQSLVLPLVMKYLCPYSVSLLGLGAIAAAAMSSADSSYLAAASIITQDIYTPFRNAFTSSKASDNEKKWVLRICILTMGVASTCLAVSVKRIYQLLVLCSDLVYVILFPALFCVIYFPWVNAYGALFGYIIGLLVRFSGGESTFYIPAFVEYPWKNEEGVSAFPYRTLAMCCSMICTTLGSIIAYAILSRLPRKFNILRVDINKQHFDEYDNKEIECTIMKM